MHRKSRYGCRCLKANIRLSREGQRVHCKIHRFCPVVNLSFREQLSRQYDESFPKRCNELEFSLLLILGLKRSYWMVFISAFRIHKSHADDGYNEKSDGCFGEFGSKQSVTVS